MTTNEGVGKKIVEALKKQADPEIEFVQNPIEFVQPIEEPETVETKENSMDESALNMFYGEAKVEPSIQQPNEDEKFVIKEEKPLNTANFESSVEVFDTQINKPNIQQDWNFEQVQTRNFESVNVPLSAKQFDMPPNVAVLKRLITQLPTGVTKQTGAQIIKQTMEALGISMNTVLHEAQKVQDAMNESIKNCMLTIQEYKNNIKNLEKQGLDYQRQVNQLNDLISLFILTDKD